MCCCCWIGPAHTWPVQRTFTKRRTCPLSSAQWRLTVALADTGETELGHEALDLAQTDAAHVGLLDDRHQGR